MTSEPSVPKSSVDELTKMGAIAGAFFFMQAAGYLAGDTACSAKSGDGLLVAAVAGAAHLSHFFLPLSGFAWPLGPVLCRALLLYAVHLPSTIRLAEQSIVHQAANVWFVALLCAVTLTSIGGLYLLFVWPNWLQWWRALSFEHLFEWAAYLLLLVVYAVGVRKFWARDISSCVRKLASQYPWPEMAVGLVVAWLLLLAYIGGRFDGHMDFLARRCAIG